MMMIAAAHLVCSNEPLDCRLTEEFIAIRKHAFFDLFLHEILIQCLDNLFSGRLTSFDISREFRLELLTLRPFAVHSLVATSNCDEAKRPSTHRMIGL